MGMDWFCEDGLIEDSVIFLILFLIMVYVIDENSFFYEMYFKDLFNCDFEIVVFFEGIVEVISMLV